MLVGLYKIYIYCMGIIFKTPRIVVGPYGKVVSTAKSCEDFAYLRGLNVNDIILFEDGNDTLVDEGRIILPRHYIIFAGTKDGVIQFKPYEFNEYRIVVSTYNDIIGSIDSIG